MTLQRRTKMVSRQITQFASQTTHARIVWGQRPPFNKEFLQLFAQGILAGNYTPGYNHATKSIDKNLNIWVNLF